MAFTDYALVALGAAVGGTFRALLCEILPISFAQMPFRILIVNALGAFLIGVISLKFNTSDNFVKYFILTGALGGFTTFSSFILDAFKVASQVGLLMSAFFLCISVITGVLAFLLGHSL